MTKRIATFLVFIIAICMSYTYFYPKDRYENDHAKPGFIPSYIKDQVYMDTKNSFSKEKAELGRYFFYDNKLSLNNSKSCASCHAQQFSFADDYKRSIGALGDLHQRNAKPLINILFLKYLTAADSSLHFPEQQMNHPMFNNHPIELGTNEIKLINAIKADSFYTNQLSIIFKNDKDPFSLKNIQYCIASFVRSIISFNSPYDKFINGDPYALDSTQQQGMQLFFSDKLKCSSCHAGINFSTPVVNNSFYFNTGLYNIDSSGAYPVYDQGLFEQTKQTRDMGAYRVPTLRNLLFTAPYYHDGTAATIEEVIDNYTQGGRNITTGVNKGDGRYNPHKSNLIKGFQLTSQQRKALISFLFSLSDTTLTKNPAFADPFNNENKNSR